MVKHFVGIELIILMMYQNVNLEHTPNMFLRRLGAALNGLKQKISQRKSFKKKAQTKTVSDVNFHLFGKICQEWIKKSLNNYSKLKI
jgi:hypothetical protein